MKRIESHIPRPSGAGRWRLPAPFRTPFDLARGAAYLGLAWGAGGQGLHLHLRAAALATRIALRRGRLPAGGAHAWLVAPLDSVRYFELDFCWRHAAARSSGALRYLDLSSPRLFALLLLRARPRLTGLLVNPDAKDLCVTAAALRDCGLQERCSVLEATAEGARLEADRFDLVTSISVLEHIPAPGDSRALRLLWDAVAPGGQLLVTVPCAREAFEEHIDRDEYGLLPRDARGFVFGQRFYDEALLRETFFATCGEPGALEIFGEREPGHFLADRARKNDGTWKPWREPWELATRWQRFASIAKLPGLGVAAMSFIKP
jgi:SAM-dependent methyltransferase